MQLTNRRPGFAAAAHSRSWHLADMPSASVDVRFQRQSRHGLRTA
jgi:hypothetical protein